MEEINTIVIAPKCELKLTSSESSLPPAFKKIRPNIRFKNIVIPNLAANAVVSLATLRSSLCVQARIVEGGMSRGIREMKRTVDI